MNLLTLVFRLPVLPVTGFVRVAELIRDQADRELHDPAAVRRQLEAAAEARRAGQISAAELDRIQAEAAGRLVAPGRPADSRLAAGEDR